MTLTPCRKCGSLVSRNSERKNIICKQCKQEDYIQYHRNWRLMHPRKSRSQYPLRRKTGARINPGTHKKAVVH